MPVSESTLCAKAHIFRISRFHLMTCKNNREKASFYKFYRVCIALIKSCFWEILGLTYRKKTERSEQFLRLAMCGLRVFANYRTRIEIRPHCLLVFSPAKNDANSAQRKEKGYACFKQVPCVLQLTDSALCVHNRTIKNSKRPSEASSFCD